MTLLNGLIKTCHKQSSGLFPILFFLVSVFTALEFIETYDFVTKWTTQLGESVKLCALLSLLSTGLLMWRRRYAVYSTIIIVFMIYALAQIPGALLWPLALFACLYITGYLIVPDAAHDTESAILAVAVGSGFWASILSASITFPIFRPILVTIAICALGVGALIVVWPKLLEIRQTIGARKPAEPKEAQSQFETVLTVVFTFIAFLFFYLIVIRSMMPSTSADDQAIYFYFLEQFKEYGFWRADPSEYSSAVLPWGLMWLSGLAYIFNGEEAAKTINAAQTFLTAGLVYFSVLRLSASVLRARAAAAAFLTVPLVGLTSISYMLDSGVVFLAVALIALVVRCKHTLHDAPFLIFAAGIVLAGAVTSKHLGLFLIPIVFVVAPMALGKHMLEKNNFRALWATAIISGGLSVAPYVISFLKSGNPVFPFYNNIFQSKFFDVTQHASLAKHGIDFDFLHTLTYFPRTFGPMVTSGNGGIGYFLIPACIAALFVLITRPKSGGAIWAGAGLLYLLCILFTSQHPRLVLGSVPMLLIASFGIEFNTGFRRRTALCYGGSALLLIAAQCVVWPGPQWAQRLGTLNTLFSAPAREQFTRTYAPHRVLNEMINQEAGRHSRVLYMGRSRGAGLRGQAMYLDWYSPYISQNIQRVKSKSDIPKFLKTFGVTHILIDGGLIKSRKPWVSLDEWIEVLEKSGQLVTSMGNWRLFALETSMSHSVNLLENARISESRIQHFENGDFKINPGGTYHLSSNAPGRTSFRIEGTIDCPDARAVILIRLDLNAPKRGRIPIYSSLFQCYPKLKAVINLRQITPDFDGTLRVFFRTVGNSGAATIQNFSWRAAPLKIEWPTP